MVDCIPRNTIMSYKDQNNKFYQNFSYKIYKTFFEVNNRSSAQEMYNANPKLIEDFLNFFDNIRPSSNRPEGKGWLDYFKINSDSGSDRMLDRCQMYFSQPSSSTTTGILNQHPTLDEVLKILLQKPFVPQNLAKAINSFKRNKNYQEILFNTFRSIKNGINLFKETYTFSNTLKDCLIDVIFSFISLTAQQQDWKESYTLLLLMDHLNFNPDNVVDFTNNLKTAAAKIFLLIEVTLKIHKIEHACDIIVGFKLYEDTPNLWKVSSGLEDIIVRRRIFNEFKEALKNPSLLINTSLNVHIKIISCQKSLTEPIDIQDSLDTLITKLLQNHTTAEASSLVGIVLQNALLSELKLSNSLLYRVLIISFVRLNKVMIAIALMLKSKSRVSAYPSTFHEDQTELNIKSCLTGEEIYVLLFYVMIVNKGSSSNLRITFTESTVPEEIMWYTGNLNCTIQAAMSRCKAQLKDLVPSVRIIQEQSNNCLIIDQSTILK